MNTLNQLREAVALMGLREAKRTGLVPDAVPSRLGRRLIADRFAEADEFGDLHITERGLRHLDALAQRGAVRYPEESRS